MRHHRDRHRLPRRHPRRGHGRARPRGPRPRRRPREDRAAVRRRRPVLRARAARAARARISTRAGCGSPPTRPRPPRSATCTSSAWAPRSSTAATRPTCPTWTTRDRRRSPPHLGRPALVVGKSTVPVGHRAAARRPAARARAGRRRRRARLEPGVPARGLRRQGHPAPGPARLRRRRRREAEATLRAVYAAGDRARARRWSSPTCRPPSWSRSPRTRSWPRRSRSSTRWPRCARPTGADVTTLSEALAHDERIGGEFLHAGLGFGGGCLPKDIRAFMARAGELGVDQALTFLREVDAINLRRRAPHGRPGPRRAGRLVRRADGRRARAPRSSPTRDDVRDSPALDVAATDPRAGRPGHASTTRRRWTTRGPASRC